MATRSLRESLWNQIRSIPLSWEDRLWLADHLIEYSEDDTEPLYDNIGTPPPATREEAIQLMEEIDREDAILGEISAEDAMKETLQLIKNYGH